MKTLFLLIISITVLGYSTNELNNIINSDKPDSEKVKAVLKLDRELKQDIQKINNFKKQYIKKYKQIAKDTMKDKTKTNYERMKAWQEFAVISEGTPYAKSGKRMAYKFSRRAFRDLNKELKKEELEAERNYEKLVSILDKILSLQIKKKQKAAFRKRRNIYASKIKENGRRSNATTVTDVAQQHRPDENKKKKAAVETQGIASQDGTVSTQKGNDKKEKPAQDTIQHDEKKSSISHKHPLSGKSIIEFRAVVYNNEATKINMLDVSDYVGTEAAKKKKLLILTFYANYCKPCKKELPFLNKLYQKYKDKGLMIIAVNTDKDKDEIKEVKEFIENNDLQFPVLKDSYNIISRRYSIENFPTMFLINSNGKILKATIGYDSNEAKLENDIVNLLK